MRLIDGDALKQTFCAECTHTLKCSDCDIDYHFEKLAPSAQQPYFIQLKNIVSNDEFRRIWEDLKHQCENIVLLHEYEQLVYPTQRWIPCSERLPEDGLYVVTNKWHHIDFLYYQRGRGWYHGNQQDIEGKATVIAWMPLPEPYKEESDD